LRNFLARIPASMTCRVVPTAWKKGYALQAFIDRVFGRSPPTFPWNDREPIREELFSVERLEGHARSLAVAQPVASNPSRRSPLAERLADNAAALLDAYRRSAAAVDEGRAVTPAAEWLIDNYHLVEKQIREIRTDLPLGYYRQLPKLLDGPFAGYPRVFGVAWAFVAHADSRFDAGILCRYVRAYQEVQPLTIGELWAISITLRIVLIENLRRLAGRITDSYIARQDADHLADRLLGTASRKPEPPSAVLAELERMPLPDAFAVEMVRKLRDQDIKVAPILAWLDEHLSSRGTNADAVVREVHQLQGSGMVTVRNIITSLRSISDVDWTELFERMSPVDDILGAGGNFTAMDFPTRNLYRSAIEELARGSDRAEIEIAKRAVMAAEMASGNGNSIDFERRSDPGYHLLAGGRWAFERAIGFRPSPRAWFRRSGRALGIRGYVGAGVIVAGALLTVPLLLLASTGLTGTWLAMLGCIGVIPAIDLSVALVNQMVTRTIGATLLPALELGTGVPSHLRTLVAVPTLLTTPDSIEEHIERLEIHHLASPEGDLHYALLSDWADADSERKDGDESLLAVAVEGIAKLNRRYAAAPGGKRFLLLHRHRVWNESEQRWIGWERKRGKLHELNHLLRGAKGTTFVAIDGQFPEVPRNVRYVITLDADTRLPRDTVRRLIGKMAHPLNRPRFDAISGRVTEGYAVLQPRVTPSLPVGREGSPFQRIFSSMNGIDPYAAAISDVYQDLFGEGSYAGKGIYDVDAFEQALADRVPDSTLLSHDLFEGVFARAGLASDVEVVEEFPARYDVAASRHHRWARGDWQLLPWIFGSGLGYGSGGAIPAMGRWKMLDNLRRTLSTPSAVLGLLLGWSLTPEAAVIWTSFILATIMLPTLIPVVLAIVPVRSGISLRSHVGALGVDLRLALAQSGLLIVLLAHQAWSMGDAIARTLVRLFVTHRHLLEWTTAAQAAAGPQSSLAGFYRRMAGGVVVAALALVVSVASGHGTWPLVLPFAALWMVSPAFAYRTSQSPRVGGRLTMSAADAGALRLTARRTWRFFESFVTAADNMLPPDNFQEDPAALAHRTSPTNMGLYLLSVVSARDFGWVGTAEAVERLEATLSTMGKLDRFHGHFYNWYDTKDLRTLDPPYVSTVDSGNLAGHLIALAGACSDWAGSSSGDAVRLAGVADALELTRQEAGRVSDGRRTQTVTWRQLHDAITALADELRKTPESHEDMPERLAGFAVRAETIVDICMALSIESGKKTGSDLVFWADAVRQAIKSHSRDFAEAERAEPAARLLRLAGQARAMALEMEYGFLFDRDRQLLAIGYAASEGKLDPNCYDLLASEARLASFLAIAKGDIPARHWFRLGRAVTPVANGAALISWSGSMFEYLMPSLVMRAPAGSLLEQTSRLIVQRQMDYGAARGVPWGVSESAYNARDIEMTYQYLNFGVPGLGLKRGLGANTVIAPYATALAAMVRPHEAAENYARLDAAGARGAYGFYEALDYTASRVPEGSRVAVVQAFMAHHQGMTIVAIADTLLDGAMRARFHGDPIVQATELLLQERTPRNVAVALPWASEAKATVASRQITPSGGRRLTTPHGSTPATKLLSNGRYAVMVTAAGSGYSRWRDLAVTRWREDATCDDWGSYVFLRDVASGKVWSAGFQPSGVEPDSYEVVFNEDRAQFTRHDGSLTTVQEIVVSAEDDAEVRRISLTNVGSHVREVELTSYCEIVLAPPAADVAHPAFSKLFVQTEYLADEGAVLATRRRRSPDEPQVWAAHLSVLDGAAVGKIEVETDRARFLGRGGSVRTAVAAIDGQPLSGTVGTVLDPVFALRRRVRVAPGATVRVAFWTMVAPTREELLDLVDKHRDTTAFERASTLAWTQAQVQLRHIGISPGEASLFQRLAGHLLYAAPTLRPSSEAILRGTGPQSLLWPLGISGDLPILLLRISDSENLDLVHQMLQAHEYWGMKRLAVDLVILNERASSYVQDLQIAIEALARTSQSRVIPGVDRATGRVYVLRTDLISSEARAHLLSVSRAVLVGQRGSLADQLDRVPDAEVAKALPAKQVAAKAGASPGGAPASESLEFFNGLGGFSGHGREYVTVLGPGQSTPAPWINVVANPNFGFQVGTEGGGSTWSVNSRENQLTPWSNDPVTDRSGEAVYLRDDASGDLWSATALPIRDEAVTYVARHGRGYSRFTHTAREIDVDLTQFVPLGDPAKISRLKLHNRSNRTRKLTIAAYAEWVLSPSRQASAAYITTEVDAATGAVFARNPWSAAFGSRISFADMGGRQQGWTCDRREFIGRNGTLARPEALRGTVALSKLAGAGLDPCIAMTTTVRIAPGESLEIVLLIGQATDVDDARGLIARYRDADLDAIEREIAGYWDDVLGSVQVTTPDRSMDIMLNGWLLYQTIACRVWARSAFYQASGAYGFRDQLQDGTALVASRPEMTREHLLRAAGRQFVEGDVQHWWLPHSGQGVRTRISDDRAWLAYATAHYIEGSGDRAVLDETIAFLEGPKLSPDEHDSFFQPMVSDEATTLFEHCARALDQSLATGAHGLPLMGTGDWNDGMNRVGEKGMGESVWLGWLLYATLTAFAPLAAARGETTRAMLWRAHAKALKVSAESEAWDGGWYRRGWFDDGTVLGSAASEECRIDCIAQSWAVISQAAGPERAAHSMAAVERELVRPQDGVALLFKPPFDKTRLDPGYIKGYPPGVRENGGQYTHAALWSVMALAKLGEGDKAAGLFSLLNPINHARTRADVLRYKTEPYVVAADIYAVAPHVGRGGWTWYTGSAGWMQRAGIESILGLRVLGQSLRIDPCIPKAWPGFGILFRHRSANYDIRVENPRGVSTGVVLAELDGKAPTGDLTLFPLADDGATHLIKVVLG
jgi:cyclic beta-1,2-glucan synthetase